MPSNEKLTEAEDYVLGMINGHESGGEKKCSASWHRSMTKLEKLITLKMLRLELPHQGTSPAELDSAIRKELKRSSA
jgi:hypothetical protein